MPNLSEPTLFSPLPSITNNYTTDPQRVAKRKRSYDPPGKCQYDENEPSSRLITKRARIVDVSGASHKAHTFNADTPREQHGCADDSALLSSSSSSIDVANFITLLLDGLNKRSQSEFSSEPVKPPSPYQRRPTSPLAQSPYRQPFVRKQVGGQCGGRVEPSLQRWVLYQNHMQDIRSCPPHLRSAEWIETLHEMGWENLHPSYALDVGDIFIPGPEDDSEDDLLEVDIGQYAQTQRLDGKM